MTQEVTNSLNFLFAVCSNTKLTKAEHESVAKAFDVIIRELQGLEPIKDVNPSEVETETKEA